MEQQQPEFLKDFKSFTHEAQSLSLYLASLDPLSTHSDPETLKSILGINQEQLNRAMKELRYRGLLTNITFRDELNKVLHDQESDISPSGTGWTKQQAKQVLEHSTDRYLDTCHYRLVPKFKEALEVEFYGPDNEQK